MPDADRPILGLLPMTQGQRRGVLILAAIIVALLGFLLLQDRTIVPDPTPVVGSRANELLDGIDPNTADARTIGALPMLGEKRAKLIVARRDDLLRSGRPIAFERVEDLLAIRGIGVGIIEQIRPYVRIRSIQSTTRPVS
ncbi:MAG: helix-hairpin-helix domain-containing protein [Tepidisphaeraceae bacterium]